MSKTYGRVVVGGNMSDLFTKEQIYDLWSILMQIYLQNGSSKDAGVQDYMRKTKELIEVLERQIQKFNEN